jgi:hypothetical protein
MVFFIRVHRYMTGVDSSAHYAAKVMSQVGFRLPSPDTIFLRSRGRYCERIRRPNVP